MNHGPVFVNTAASRLAQEIGDAVVGLVDAYLVDLDGVDAARVQDFKSEVAASILNKLNP